MRLLLRNATHFKRVTKTILDAGMGVPIRLGAAALLVVSSLMFTTAAPVAASCSAQSINVTDDNGVAQLLTNDNFGGGALCVNHITGQSHDSNFNVNPGDDSGNGGVESFPNIHYGCDFPPSTTCTSGTNLPMHLTLVSSIHLTMSTDHSNVASGDEFNSSTDLFFQPSATNPDPSAEVMVWQNDPSITTKPPQATTVPLGGNNYWRWTNARSAVISGQTVKWTEVIYLRTPQTSSFNNLDLDPILSDAILSNLGLDFTQYLRYVGCGFEVWSGGANLTMNNCLLNIVHT